MIEVLLAVGAAGLALALGFAIIYFAVLLSDWVLDDVVPFFSKLFTR